MTHKVENNEGPIGATITGMNLMDERSREDMVRLREIIDTRAVVVIRNQVGLSSSNLTALARFFGVPQVNVRAEANNEANPEIFWVSNVHENGKPLGSHDAGRYWHTDQCYLEKPSDLTLLHALEIPAKDGVSYGSTQFSSATAAYDVLQDELKSRIKNRKARNSYRFMWNRKAHEFGKRPVLNEEELNKFPEDAVHPIVRTHPRTGQKCLYVCDGYTHRIEGVTLKESNELLHLLFDQLRRPDLQYNHDWRVGDLLIWDNCAVQHKARFDYPPELRRRMQRCTIEGGVPY